MKIAIVHNEYGKFSGEEMVVQQHIAGLRERGCEICQFRRSSAELQGCVGKVKGFASGLWNPFSCQAFSRFLKDEKPDVIHIHNLYPLINPGILSVPETRHIPIVMSVHNFRLVCPNGLFMTHGKICEACAENNSSMPCIVNNCLRSIPKSVGYSLRTSIARNFGWYKDNVDRFLCLTQFQLDKLNKYGFPRNKLEILPNFIDDSWMQNSKTNSSSSYVAYAGRFSNEKGIEVILKAAQRCPEIPFYLAGAPKEALPAELPDNVHLAGFLSQKQLADFIKNARILMMASRCYEGFPTSLLQGMAFGIPCLVPELGGMPDIVGAGGDTFPPEDDQTLAEKIRAIWNSDELRKEMGENAVQRCINNYTVEVVMNHLVSIYEQLIKIRK